MFLAGSCNQLIIITLHRQVADHCMMSFVLMCYVLLICLMLAMLLSSSLKTLNMNIGTVAQARKSIVIRNALVSTTV